MGLIELRHRRYRSMDAARTAVAMAIKFSLKSDIEFDARRLLAVSLALAWQGLRR